MWISYALFQGFVVTFIPFAAVVLMREDSYHPGSFAAAALLAVCFREVHTARCCSRSLLCVQKKGVTAHIDTNGHQPQRPYAQGRT